MRPFVLALRAIGAGLAMRLYIPAVIIASTVMALLIIVAVLLTSQSEWWLLLFIPITVLFCILLAVASVLLMLIRFVQPVQTTAQKQAVKRLVDKIEGITEVAGTPKFIVLFRVIRSIAAPSKDSYLSDIVSNRELAKDFRALQQSFDTPIVID